jgi:hypothetical protein
MADGTLPYGVNTNGMLQKSKINNNHIDCSTRYT